MSDYGTAYDALLPLLQERHPHGVGNTPEALASVIATLVEEGLLTLPENGR